MNDDVEPKLHTELLAASQQCSGVDIYSCEEALKRLNDYLDHELNDDERTVVVKHLEIC